MHYQSRVIHGNRSRISGNHDCSLVGSHTHCKHYELTKTQSAWFEGLVILVFRAAAGDNFPVCLPASVESFQSGDSELWTLSPCNLIKLSNPKTLKMTLKCQLLLFHSLMEQQKVLKLCNRNRIISEENVQEAIQKWHGHGRKCKRKWGTEQEPREKAVIVLPKQMCQ